MSKGVISEDIPFEESYLSKYGEVPEIDCQPMVFRPDTNKSKRPTHFLAIRINSPALWSHVLSALELFLVWSDPRGIEANQP